MNELCGNTWCKYNNKQCECKVNKGLNFALIEDVENTEDKQLIKVAYEGREECYEEDSRYVKNL